MGWRVFALDALPDEPWRNGGGRTRVVAVQPCGAQTPKAEAVVGGGEPPWDWRISVATIERSGPFSPLPGVDRSSLLLGAGWIKLSAAGETKLQMQQPGDRAVYRGDAAWHAEVWRAGPPLSLLNVMTRRSAAVAQVLALRDDAIGSSHTLAVFVIDGRWRVVDPSADAADAGPGDGVVLAAGAGAVSDAAGTPSPPVAAGRIERLSTTGLLAAVVIERTPRGSR